MSWVMRRQLVTVGLVVLLTSVVTVTASQSSAASQVDIVILGGPSAVSATVEARLKTCTTGSVSRVAGSNRYETAATISAASFSSSEGAYIATGLNFPDGLAGGPSAALDRQPVLLVNDAIPAATRTELARLGVSRVTVLGGPVAVPDGVVASLNALVPTTRIAGSDRYSTAAAIAQGAFPSADTVYVATGVSFPDALAGVPAAAGDAAPILLVRQNSIPASTAAQLIRLKPTTIKILGGEAAVSAGVAAGLGNYASNVVRFAGSDRYTTAVAISRHAFPNSASRIYIATGLDYPDALAGGPAAAVDDGPILLVRPSAIPNATKAEIQRITGTTCAPPTLDDTTLGLQVVADGFERPVFFTTHGEHGFVVDQPGRIWGFGRTGDPEVVLDIRDRVASGGERGLLGLAFHPEYGDLFYVNYTRSGDGATVVSEFAISGDPPIADLDSERVILVVSQPAPNHNGGMLAFGPRGDLWIGMGDGGSANDGFGNAQRGDTLLGSLLRIHVGPGLDPYGVVEPHRYAAPEIWAIGLRNPWRFSFDEDLIWIADVGQDAVEEVDRESTDDLGLNLGWPIYEGSECNTGPCGTNSGFAVPAYQYRHNEGCSITGGYVYRGSAIPQLDGHYFFSDWCSGFIRSIGQDGVVHDWTDGTGPVDQVSSFGRDNAGEVYVVSATGTVYRIVDTTG